eukprot:TRINITY_DN108_c0_g2_i1.p1 TRINITY_DN108_c0_g2~~TRINITY_DN108_c0_g2_i1.p1  ORF type:complete len:240 (+),score=25.73 TRINITY_DN108_c0_g2_i1:362-1081(+)
MDNCSSGDNLEMDHNRICTIWNGKTYTIWKRRLHLKVYSTQLLPDNVVLIKFERPKGFVYSPGAYIRLQIPEISKLQWHAITLTSSPHENFLSVHLRSVGDWTFQMMDLFVPPDTKPETRVSLRNPVRRFPSQQFRASQRSISIVSQPSLGGIVRENSGTYDALSSVSPRDDLTELKEQEPEGEEKKVIPVPDDIYVRCDGPIGTVTAELQYFKYAVFVAAGIGATPVFINFERCSLSR